MKGDLDLWRGLSGSNLTWYLPFSICSLAQTGHLHQGCRDGCLHEDVPPYQADAWLCSCFSIFNSGKETLDHFQHHERVRCTLKLHCFRKNIGIFKFIFRFCSPTKGFLQKLASQVPGTKQGSCVSTQLCYKPEVALSWCIWYIVMHAPSGSSSSVSISLKWRRIHSKGIFWKSE